ncbi:hypothetical protein EVA_09960, partial [gut metagenome]
LAIQSKKAYDEGVKEPWFIGTGLTNMKTGYKANTAVWLK